MPKLKLKFKKGIHNSLLTNWKEPIDLLKKTHKNKETTLFNAFTSSSENHNYLECTGELSEEEYL